MDREKNERGLKFQESILKRSTVIFQEKSIESGLFE